MVPGWHHLFWACDKAKHMNNMTKGMKSRIAFGGQKSGGGEQQEGPRAKTDSPKVQAQGLTSSK